jgi:NADH:ubiquinone oxidoreductase subunit D
MKNPLMTTRAKGMGVMTLEDVDTYYLAGPIARSTGAQVDIRLDAPYAGYDEMEMEYASCDTGDTRDRLLILYKELDQSMDLIRQALAKIEAGIESGEMDPTKDHMVKIPKKLPAGEAISRVEWARGELLMHLVTEEKGASPYRLKIKAPSVNHTMMLDNILRGKTLSDIPLLYGSMHICQGDLDR